MRFTEETIRRKKRFIGDLRTFKKKFDLYDKEIGEIIGARGKCVTNWFSDRVQAMPHPKYIDGYRQKMKEYADVHPTLKIDEPQESLFEEKKIRGGGHTIGIARRWFLFQAVCIFAASGSRYCYGGR